MKLTPEEIKAFQRNPRHRNHLGEALEVDGWIGPQTQWALAVEDLAPKRRAIIHFCLDMLELKITEQPIGSNRHPWIDATLLRCGVAVGSAWCAAGASLAVSASGLNLHEASVARLSKLLPHTNNPQPGDLSLYLNADGTGHVWVDFAVSETELLTWECNQAHAIRVCTRPRFQVGRVLQHLCTVPLPGVMAAPQAGGSTR